MIDFPSVVYNAVRDSHGLRNAVWSAVRDTLVAVAGDPTCRQATHGRTLFLPLSHQLPLYLERYPFYDSLPLRIGAYLHQRDGHLTCIDVGANVGDTVAAFFASDGEEKRALAIEPNARFRSFLVRNWGGDPRVTILPFACASSSGVRIASFLERGGTASIVSLGTEDSASKPSEVEVRTLDEILASHPAFTGFNVLKVDTDGNDFAVLQGAWDCIGRNRPLVLFECEAYADARFVEHTVEVLARFRRMGYGAVLQYDNFGVLVARLSLSDQRGLGESLFYMLTGGCAYYDLLVLKEEDADDFHGREQEFFLASMKRTHLVETARHASKLAMDRPGMV